MRLTKILTVAAALTMATGAYAAPVYGTFNVTAYQGRGSGNGGGTITGTYPNGPLSMPGFGSTTLFSIIGTTAAPLAGTVTHDDGASLHQGSTTIFDSSAPTSAIPTSYTVPAGPFQLVYVEANGAPAVLTMDAIPEPASVGLLGAGLIALGLVTGRRTAV